MPSPHSSKPWNGRKWRAPRTSTVLHAHHDLSFSIIIDSATSPHIHERARLPSQAREWLDANEATEKLQTAKKTCHSYGKQWEETKHFSILNQHCSVPRLYVAVAQTELSSTFRFSDVTTNECAVWKSAMNRRHHYVETINTLKNTANTSKIRTLDFTFLLQFKGTCLPQKKGFCPRFSILYGWDCIGI